MEINQCRIPKHAQPGDIMTGCFTFSKGDIIKKKVSILLNILFITLCTSYLSMTVMFKIFYGERNNSMQNVKSK